MTPCVHIQYTQKSDALYQKDISISNCTNSWQLFSPACTKRYFQALDIWPYKGAIIFYREGGRLSVIGGNNWTDSCSESKTS